MTTLPAYAEDTSANTPAAADPFQMDHNDWKSFDHYNSDQATNPPQQPVPGGASVAKALPAVAAPSLSPQAASTSSPQAPAQTSAAPALAPPPTVETSAGKAVVASPSRPLLLPVMPAMNSRGDRPHPAKDARNVPQDPYSLRIDTTEDTKPLPVFDTTPAAASEPPRLPSLPDSHWQKADKAAIAVGGKSLDPIDNDQAIPVRLSFLPGRRVRPAPFPDRPEAHNRSAMIKAQMAEDAAAPPLMSKPKTPEQKAACMAIDAYKKQQLQAIQSDRQTLAALQSAIAQLGLQKQLDFLTNPDSTLNNGKPGAETALTISAPGPATAAAPASTGTANPPAADAVQHRTN